MKYGSQVKDVKDFYNCEFEIGNLDCREALVILFDITLDLHKRIHNIEELLYEEDTDDPYLDNDDDGPDL